MTGGGQGKGDENSQEGGKPLFEKGFSTFLRIVQATYRYWKAKATPEMEYRVFRIEKVIVCLFQ